MSHDPLKRCPMCRQTFFTCSPPIVEDRRKRRCRRMDLSARKAGVTLCNSYEGVLVRKVNAGGAAQAAGIRAGDVITHMNGIRCTTHAHAAALLDSASAKRAKVQCQMEGKMCCVF